MSAWRADPKVRAALPHAGVLGGALLIQAAGAVTHEPRIYYFYGLPIAVAHLLWGSLASGALAAALAALALISVPASSLSALLPLFLAGTWGASMLAERASQEESLRVSLAQEQDRQASSGMAEALGRERDRVAASRERIEKIHMLTSVASDLSATLELHDVVAATLVRTRELTGQIGEPKIVQFEGEGVRTWRLVDGQVTVAREDADPLVLWIRERGLPLMVSDLPRDLRFRNVPGDLPTSRSLIAAPLSRARAVSGVLEVASDRTEAFSGEDWRLLSLLADLASVAIQNAQLYHRTQEEAITDGLTGTFVHRFFQDRLVEELRRSKERSAPLALLMIDIDNFKGVNDTWGHPAGDAVLRRVALALREGVRGTDLVARYGGEEFAVLLVETGPDAALVVAERLRAAVESLTPADLGVNRPVTISVGLAAVPDHAGDERALIERADESLYAAKRGGKNRVVVASA